jgi:hypothetical protein
MAGFECTMDRSTLGRVKRNLADIEVTTMGAWSVIVTVHWIIDHVNGSVLRDFYSIYNLIFQDGD